MSKSKSTNEEEIAWVDGAIVPASQARVSVLDHGFLFGDGVFEGIRVTPAGIFRFDDHIRRLEIAARAIGIDVEGGMERVRAVARETTLAWGRREGYLRLILSRGVGALGLDPASCPTPTIVCIAAGTVRLPADKAERGVDLITSSLRRPAGDVLDPRVKSLNYLNNILAKREANLRGADDALMLNAQGLIAEASAANVFALTGNRLETPPVSDGALEGMTRRTVLEIATDLGLDTRQRSLGRFDLFAAHSVFYTGSRAGLVPVASLDGSAIDQSARPRVQEIQAVFQKRLIELSVSVD
jgi:branched-chain amino acid aminotransferase